MLLIPILIFRYIPLQRKDVKPFIFIFCLGVLVVTASTVAYVFRIHELRGAARAHRDLTDIQDLDRFIIDDIARVQTVRLASVAEAMIGLLVMSMPSVRVFLRRNDVLHGRITPAAHPSGATGSRTPAVSWQSTARLSDGKFHAYLELDATNSREPVTPPMPCARLSARDPER